MVVGFEDSTLKKALTADNLNWISIDSLTSPIEATAKIRSTQIPSEVRITPTNKNEVKVEFLDLQKSVTPGQSIVFYDNDVVIGGGIIQKVY